MNDKKFVHASTCRFDRKATSKLGALHNAFKFALALVVVREKSGPDQRDDRVQGARKI